jgi:hypothetical protein
MVETHWYQPAPLADLTLMREAVQADSAASACQELLARLAGAFTYARVLRVLADVEPELTRTMECTPLAPRLYARELRARVALTGRGLDEPQLRCELRSAVASFARTLRARNVPPETMLVTVKQTARVPAPADARPDEVARVHADIVEWAVGGYYTP